MPLHWELFEIEKEPKIWNVAKMRVIGMHVVQSFATSNGMICVSNCVVIVKLISGIIYTNGIVKMKKKWMEFSKTTSMYGLGESVVEKFIVMLVLDE